VCQDIRILGVKNWRSVALNREEWRKFWGMPGLTKGCRSSDDDDDDDASFGLSFKTFRRLESVDYLCRVGWTE
jgi:hypothetical protein